MSTGDIVFNLLAGSGFVMSLALLFVGFRDMRLSRPERFPPPLLVALAGFSVFPLVNFFVSAPIAVYVMWKQKVDQ